ncbi:MAG: efflux RND transporter periplasmic adaptor subunit [Planctomycetes bacterium]|nr:efflux RND transporter periplasmic adaptor subunit [Planctomycetota bacterium]
MKHRSLLAPGLLALAALAPSCDRAQSAPPPSAPPTVEFVRPTSRELVDWEAFTGRLAAVERVDVRARVSGYLQSIHFQDGALVEEGQLLFVIDPRPFEAELAAKRAELAQAEAGRDLARGNVERGRELLESNAIAAEDAATREAALTAADALVQSAAARVQAAELDLGYTRITAPMAGRVGAHGVSVGNLVTAGALGEAALATIVTTGPVHCWIEADSTAVMRLLRGGHAAGDAAAAVRVQVGLEDETDYPHEGTLDFVDNAFDPGTATLALRALLPNESGVLTPGMFVRARLVADAPRAALLVPEKAVQSDQTMRYLLVLDDADTVRFRPVEVGRLTEDGLREITSGVAPDERVVAAGLFMARPGATVSPREAAPQR